MSAIYLIYCRYYAIINGDTMTCMLTQIVEGSRLLIV